MAVAQSGEVLLAIVGGEIGAADGPGGCGETSVILEGGDPVEGPGPGCSDGGIELGKYVGDPGDQCGPVIFSPEPHCCCEKFRVVAGGGNEGVPNPLDDGCDRTAREERDDGSDGGVHRCRDGECVFEDGGGGEAEGLCKALGVVAGNGDRWWWWRCGDAGGHGVCEAPVLIDIGSEPGGAFPDDGWWYWRGGGGEVWVRAVGSCPGVVDVGGDPCWDPCWCGGDGFILEDIERVLDLRCGCETVIEFTGQHGHSLCGIGVFLLCFLDGYFPAELDDEPPHRIGARLEFGDRACDAAPWCCCDEVFPDLFGDLGGNPFRLLWLLLSCRVGSLEVVCEGSDGNQGGEVLPYSSD